MLRLAVPFILLLLLLFAGAVWLVDLPLGPLTPERQATEKSGSQPTTAEDEAKQLQDALRPSPPPQDGAPAFDIARIDPNGTSVFAGRAEPGSAVTITADGKEIGTAKADENGEWTFTTEAKIPNPDAKLALFKAPPGTKVADAAPSSEVKPEAPQQKTAGAVTSTMLKNLEGMVAAARTNDDKQGVATAAPPPGPVTEEPPAPSGAGASVAAPPSVLPSAPATATRASVPVPVTFVYNEATLTSDGRRAAALLLEYLQIKRFPRVRLTGHADERGSDALNMNLSRERLDTVAKFLRDGGFKGELDLIPKGKAEPYLGVVRGDFSQEDLWQLDRRVELVVSR